MAFAPQNTVESFLLAQEQGADGVELDVQLTSDGVLVVFHDARVDALTDGKGPLASLPWQTVRRLDAGSHFGPGWGHVKIPTLEDVLAALDPRLTVNVELKTALSEESWWDKWLSLLTGPRKLSESRIQVARDEAQPLAEATVRVLAADPGRFLISSFDPLALAAVAPLLPGVPLGFLHSRTVPWDTPTLMAAIDHQAWHPHHSQVNSASVARERAAGRRVHVWTVNDGAQAVRLARLGADALITNRPGEIIASLEERGALANS
jgi:glycerophosphoryl diester phosphodiesterase